MCRYLQRQPLLLILVNFGSSNSSGSDLNGTGTRSAITTDEKLDALLSKFVHFETQIAQIPALTNWMSRMDSHITKTLGDFVTGPTEMEQNFSTLTARQLYPVLQDPGLHSNKLTAPQTQGPMAQDHLMTTETQDADLILPQALLMNMREVPSYYDSHVNSTTLELRSGSILFGKGPTYQPTINLSQFIAMQVPCRPDLCLKQELNVKTLLPDIRMMVSPTKLVVLFAKAEPISLSASPSHLKTGKLENNFAPL